MSRLSWCFVALAALASPILAFGEFRTWTSADGNFKTEAEYVGMKDAETVVIKKPDAQIIDVPLSRLSATDQEYVRVKTATSPSSSATPTGVSSAEVDRDLRAVEREAQNAKTAEEAVVIYTIYLSNPDLPESAKTVANTKLQEWKGMAEKGLVRLGTKWVTVEEARAARVKSVFLVNQGLEMIRLNQDELGFEKLHEASTTAPDDILADFIMGTTNALALNRFDKADQHYKQCLRRDPTNPVVLNNLALVQIRLRRPDQALMYWRQAAAVCQDERIVQNIARLFEMAGNREITVSSSVLSQLSDIYATLVLAHNVKAGENRSGWQYMVLPQEPPIDESTVELPADTGVDGTTMVCGNAFVVAPEYVLTTRSSTKGLAGFLIADPNEPGKKLQAKLVASSKDSDLALLHCPELKAPAAPLDVQQARMDTDVLVGGYPQSDTMASSIKISQGLTRSPSIVGSAGVILYDVPKAPSVVGGPVVDGMGNVIALHWKSLAALNNRYNAGIPISRCMSFINSSVPGLKFKQPGKVDQPLVDVEKQLSHYTVVVMAKAPAQDVGLNKRVGQGFLLDLSCCKCNGSKIMQCPVRNCTNGGIAYYETIVTGTIPTTGDKITRTVKKYNPCSNCGGRGSVACGSCRGTGKDPNISPTAVRSMTNPLLRP